MTPQPTQRLVFRTWRDDDFALAQRLFGDPRVTAKVGGPFDDAQIGARLASETATEREHGYQYWPMFASDIFIGCCGLKPRPDNGLEFGFYICAAEWGKGYATEAGRSVLAFVFDTLNAPAVGAGHHPENDSSRKALLKLGFTYSHHELYPPTGLEHPGYVITALEYRAAVPH
jgi:ribosomal-protein-alanine N-acetyltransferase